MLSLMTPIPLRLSAVLLLGGTLAFAQGASTASSIISAQARQIHDSALIVDTHADTPQRFLFGNYDIANTDPQDPGHISLDKARAGNLGAEFFSIWVDPETNQGHFAQTTFDMIDSVYQQAHDDGLQRR
jgi:membrane dipeptidase